MFIGSWCNFNFSATGSDRWDKVMAKIPFFVHLTTNASEMSQFADIVLPATFAPTEKLTIITNMANLHGHMSIQQPVAKPLWQVKAEETGKEKMKGDQISGWDEFRRRRGSTTPRPTSNRPGPLQRHRAERAAHRIRRKAAAGQTGTAEQHQANRSSGTCGRNGEALRLFCLIRCLLHKLPGVRSDLSHGCTSDQAT